MGQLQQDKEPPTFLFVCMGDSQQLVATREVDAPRAAAGGMIGCLGHYPMLLPNFMKCVLSGLSARRVSLDPAKPLCDPCGLHPSQLTDYGPLLPP
ncbi:hypothetical protein VTN96DRAFT_1009 [Rasamsonia emersonii]